MNNTRVMQIVETLFGVMVAVQILRTAQRHPAVTGWDLLEYGLLLWCVAAPVVVVWWRRQFETDAVFRQTVVYLATSLFIGILTALQLK
jgi:hypothetical protein